MVSCQEEFDVVKKAMKLGAYDYLRKLNLSSDELESILEKCLGETEERNKVHMQGIREIRYEEIMRDSRDIFAGTCNYQTLICILAKDTEELSGVMEMIHKWAETELREGLQIRRKEIRWIFPAEKKKPERSVYNGIKRKGQSGKQAENCTWESLKVAWKKLRILFGLLRWPSRYSFSVIMIKKRNWLFFQKKIETEGHSPRGMHGYLRQEGKIEVNCRFCNRKQVYTPEEVEAYSWNRILMQLPWEPIRNASVISNDFQ